MDTHDILAPRKAAHPRALHTLRLALTALALMLVAARAELPMDVCFQGEERFHQLIERVKPLAERIRTVPVGERTAWFGQLFVGTPYRGFTLEIHDHIEAPSCNLRGLDCWTFFEVALAFARMSELPVEQWTPRALLGYIEMDRYWGGNCTGSYLSRLHYLEDWLRDNDRRGLVTDLTRQLGGVGVPNAATEMTNNASHYRYMRSSAENREGIAKLEARLRRQPLVMIPKEKVAAIEPQIRSGDIIGIVSRDGDAYGTSHVGIALRKDGVLRLMHASAPSNHGRVVVDARLSVYLSKFKKHAGILVARPAK